MKFCLRSSSSPSGGSTRLGREIATSPIRCRVEDQETRKMTTRARWKAEMLPVPTRPRCHFTNE